MTYAGQPQGQGDSVWIGLHTPGSREVGWEILLILYIAAYPGKGEAWAQHTSVQPRAGLMAGAQG